MGDVEIPVIWKRRNQLKKDLTSDKRLPLRGLLFFSNREANMLLYGKEELHLIKKLIKEFFKWLLITILIGFLALIVSSIYKSLRKLIRGS